MMTILPGTYGSPFGLLLTGAASGVNVQPPDNPPDPGVQVPAGYLARWKADGNAEDATGRYNGTWVYGAAEYATGKTGLANTAFAFGTAESSDNVPYVLVRNAAGDHPPLPLTTVPVTVGCWVRFYQFPKINGNTNNIGYIISAGPESWALGLWVDGSLRYGGFWYLNYWEGTTPRITDSDWHHVVMVIDENWLVKIYIDKVLVETFTPYHDFAVDPASDNFYTIGNASESNTALLTEAIYGASAHVDDVIHYGRVLSEQEISNWYEATATLAAPPSGSANRLLDEQGNPLLHDDGSNLVL